MTIYPRHLPVMTGPELKSWRETLGWTQPKAANELRLSLRQYCRSEATSPTPAISRLAEMLADQHQKDAPQ